MRDSDFIKTKIELIQKDLEHLKDLSGFTMDEIAGDFYKWSTLKLVLAEIIGRAIDINAHIIAEEGDAGEPAPASSRETFVRLGTMGVLPKDFAEEIAQSAGFRNRIVHEYNDLERNKVYETVDAALGQYTRYCGYIMEYLV
jgi:uncharacterized protein YutE (UPF0331/DUF86 family)